MGTHMGKFEDTPTMWMVGKWGLKTQFPSRGHTYYPVHKYFSYMWSYGCADVGNRKKCCHRKRTFCSHCVWRWTICTTWMCMGPYMNHEPHKKFRQVSMIWQQACLKAMQPSWESRKKLLFHFSFNPSVLDIEPMAPLHVSHPLLSGSAGKGSCH